MEYVAVEKTEGVTTLILHRGKVNALNEAVVDEMKGAFTTLEKDEETRAIIFTGRGKFFSFGFDIPEFLSYTKKEFIRYLTEFTGLYTYMFSYPKPIVAALNGHTIAGGCMLALACDHRIMVTGRARISLNEISFGASVFAGCMEMLCFWAGRKNATEVLSSGAMYTAEEAKEIGMIEEIATEKTLKDRAIDVAIRLGSKHPPAFTSIKQQLRKPFLEEMLHRESKSIEEFVEIWYSKATWKNLQNIKIL